MAKYQRNNIIFRISSADAIAKFKASQALSFLQLTRKELNFDEAAKETVLLEYDRLSQWIFRIEKICMAAGEGYMPQPLRQSIVDSFHDELNLIETVLESHPDVFSRKSIEFTKMIHAYAEEMIADQMYTQTSTSMDSAYAKVVDIVSQYLQHLLISFHEYNNNLVTCTQPVFIGVANFCIAMATGADRFFACAQRAKFFEKNGAGSTFVFKNYSDWDVFEDAQSFFAKRGISLIQEKEEEKLSE